MNPTFEAPITNQSLLSPRPLAEELTSSGESNALSEQPVAAPGPRRTTGGPWCWASKEALQVLHDAFADHNMLASARSVYFALCEIASDKGRETFQISICAIKVRAGVSDRWARKILQHLAMAGLLVIEVNKAAGGLNLTSTYTLCARRTVARGRSPGSECRARGSGSARPVPTLEEKDERKNSTPYPHHADPPLSNDALSGENAEHSTTVPATSPRRRLRASGAGVEFSKFWAAYPRKIAQHEAEKAWVKLGCDPLIDTILSTLEAAKRSEQWTKDGGRFIPYPATWIQGRRWEDQFDPPPPAPGDHGDLRKEAWHVEWVPWLERTGQSMSRNREYQFAEPLVKDAFWKERLARKKLSGQ
jgi:hypothetical protein